MYFVLSPFLIAEIPSNEIHINNNRHDANEEYCKNIARGARLQYKTPTHYN